MLSRRIAALSVLLALASAGTAAEPEPVAPPDASCGADGSGCAIGADDSAMAAVDKAAADQAAGERRPIEAPYGKAWLGAADGDVVLVVFADYACSHCRDAQPLIDQLVGADPRLKVVYRLMINDPKGRDATMTSLAVAQMPGAIWTKFHRALDAGGDPTPASIAAALKQAGINPRSLPDLGPDALIGSPLITELSRNDEQFQERGATGLPAWVIGDGKAVAGMDIAEVRAAVAAARGAQE
jgi:protein-disulfide isomerase